MAFREGVEAMADLEIVGDPEMCNIAFKSSNPSLDVYKVQLAHGYMVLTPSISQNLGSTHRHKLPHNGA